jgi:pyrroline-5-carboxylate reductase
MQNRTLGFIGAGNMASALIRGLIESNFVSTDGARASDPSAERRKTMQVEFGITVHAENRPVIEASDVIVVAVKPQVVAEVLADLRSAYQPRHLIISLLAGVPIARFQSALPDGARIVRAMSNTPALVRAGATALAGGEFATDDDLTLSRDLFSQVGTTAILDESLLDAVTGLSGSGPAYVMLVIEALADGGVKMGLSREVAQRFAAQTLYGAAKLLLESNAHPGVLKDRVASPGGTTIAGLYALEQRGVRRALMSAVVAATERSIELGRLASQPASSDHK